LLTGEGGLVGGKPNHAMARKPGSPKNNSILSGKTQRKLKGNYWEKAKR
jgi:hypothetical protein